MRILFLTHRLPYAPNRGDRIRAIHLMREMAQVGDVSLFSLVHDDEEVAAVGQVPFAQVVTTVRAPRVRNLAMGAARWLTSRPLTHTLLDAPDAVAAIGRLVAAAPPDVVVAYCSGMARFALEPPLAGIPFVLDMVDVDSAKWRELAARARAPRRWIYAREARTLGAFETLAATRAVESFVVNDKESLTLRAIAPAARVRVVPNGIDLASFTPAAAPASAPVVTFCGVMNYPPNEAGVLWFATEVWTRVRAAVPGARFQIVGARPTAGVRGLAARDGSIEVTGAVPAVQPYLRESAIAVAPLPVARGFQNKVLEAVASGLPVVVTPAVAEGLPRSVLPSIVVATDAPAFAAAVIHLLQLTPAARRALAGAAQLSDLGWSEALRDVGDVLRSAARSAAPRSQSL
jgi:sugar transferase (PEP-CTERM/EpsH1 system associated)